MHRGENQGGTLAPHPHQAIFLRPPQAGRQAGTCRLAAQVWLKPSATPRPGLHSDKAAGPLLGCPCVGGRAGTQWQAKCSSGWDEGKPLIHLVKHSLNVLGVRTLLSAKSFYADYESLLISSLISLGRPAQVPRAGVGRPKAPASCLTLPGAGSLGRVQVLGGPSKAWLPPAAASRRVALPGSIPGALKQRQKSQPWGPLKASP